MFENGYYYEIQQVKGVYEYRIWKEFNDGSTPLYSGCKNSHSLAKKIVKILIKQDYENSY